jgi:hypothetical protein
MKKTSYILLIFLFSLSILSPINAQTANVTPGVHPTDLLLYGREANPGNWVTTVNSGETAHIVAHLKTSDNSDTPVDNQLITLRLMACRDFNHMDNHDLWYEITNPPMVCKVTTGSHGEGKGRIIFDIFTQNLKAGNYRISAYYAGNKYDYLPQEDKLEPSTCEGLLIINPPN